MTARLISSYRGESYYYVGSARVAVRYRASDDGAYMPGIYVREVLPLVGCLTNRDDITAFPSQEAQALFPLAIPARWTGDGWEYFNHAKPATAVDRFGTFAVDLCVVR